MNTKSFEKFIKMKYYSKYLITFDIEDRIFLNTFLTEICSLLEYLQKNNKDEVIKKLKKVKNLIEKKKNYGFYDASEGFLDKKYINHKLLKQIIKTTFYPNIKKLFKIETLSNDIFCSILEQILKVFQYIELLPKSKLEDKKNLMFLVFFELVGSTHLKNRIEDLEDNNFE